MDNSGEIKLQFSLPSSNLRTVKSVKYGGYAAVGETTFDGQAFGLLVVGNSGGYITKLTRFMVPGSTYPVLIQDFVELENDRFGVVLDSYGDSYGTFLAHVIIAEVDPITDELFGAHRLGSTSDTLKVFVRGIFNSPQGGYNLAGVMKPKFGKYSLFIGELSDSLLFPDYTLYETIESNGLIAVDATSEIPVNNADFRDHIVDGFEAIDLQFTHDYINYSEDYISFADSCSVIPTTLSPTVSPSTGTPSSLPTPIPSTGFPTLMPVTPRPSKVNETWTPTQCPSIHPSDHPTRGPTTQPSAAPSIRPSCYPSIVPSVSPSFTPATLMPTKPTFSPTSLGLSPTAEPSKQGEPEPLNAKDEGMPDKVLLVSGCVLMGMICLMCCFTLVKTKRNFQIKLSLLFGSPNRAHPLSRSGKKILNVSNDDLESCRTSYDHSDSCTKMK